MKKILFLFPILFIGCATKTTPIALTFKGANVKISDQGFYKKSFFKDEIDIYVAGNLAFVFKLYKNQICIDDKCYEKKLFVNKLNNKYPINFFDILLDKKELPHLKKVKIPNGFKQTDTNIVYIVTENRTFFVDKKNKIIFIMKKLSKK